MSRWLWITLITVALGLLGSLLWSRSQPRAETLKIGAPAPDFALADAQGSLRHLSDFRGAWLLLYFYPKDASPICTKEACVFRDGYSELRRRGVQVVGISTDDSTSHRDFAEKYRLPFPLLSDRTGRVAESYGALWSLGPLRFARRHSFLIDASGNISHIYRSVDADTHYRQVLDDLDESSKNLR